MPTISDKLKKTKHTLKKFVANRTFDWPNDSATLERLEAFVDKVLEGGVDPIIEAWTDEPVDMSLMPEFEATQATGQNRFKHIGCLEATRVPVHVHPGEKPTLIERLHPEKGYIHANYISTPKTKKKFIVTQSPSGKTCIDFWNMVMEQGVEIIVGLTPLDRDQGQEAVIYHELKYNHRVRQKNWLHYEGLSSCARYFPRDICIYQFERLEDAPMDVECVDMFEHEYELNGKRMIIIERILEISRRFEDPYVVRHFHWVWNKPLTREWHSIPMQFLEDLPKTDKPIVLQCESGSHLSSAFVMCQYYLDLLEMNRKLPPPSQLLQKLRDQCHNAFSNWNVWLWVHMVLVQFFMEKIGKHHLRIKQFKKEYQAIMKKEIIAQENQRADYPEE